MRCTKAVNHFLLIVAGLLTPHTSLAQVAPGEAFHYEAAVSWLAFSPGGNVQTNSNRVDFRSDLGIDDMQSQFGFWFLAKPWERNGIFVEFIPYRYDGELTITRSYRFGGVTFPVNQPVTAKASLTWISGGYHRDLVDRSGVQLGLLVGAGYMAVRSEATSPAVGTAEVDRDVPFPIVGLSTRYWPAPQSNFSFRGDVRAMTFGSYGHYIDAAAMVGYNVSRHVTLEGGYRVVDGEGHHRTRGADLIFRGPTITLRLHDN
jgi:hypothetical protein